MGTPPAKLAILCSIFCTIGGVEHITLSHDLLSFEYGTSSGGGCI
jgi:hypothetical protein